MKNKINFILNGEKISINTEPLKRLLDVLRDELGLTGTKEGCGEGECGACAVLVDNKLINSCTVPIISLEGKSIITIEGYKKTLRFNKLKESFERVGAVQCGFCTIGMILAAEALLIDNPKPTEKEVREAISGNLCRCTGYNMIVEAILLASREGSGLWQKCLD